MRSLLCVAAFTTAPVVEARPTFVQSIPNGASVSGVRALGHQNPAGDGPTNAFGEAFEADGSRWTTALCRVNSDGDGATNGEELGDPCCTWQQGGVVARSSSLTHPGVPNAFSARDLAAMRCNAGTNATTTENRSPTPTVPVTDPVGASSPVSPVAATDTTPTVPTPQVKPPSSPKPSESTMTPAPVSGSLKLVDMRSVALVVACCGLWLFGGP